MKSIPLQMFCPNRSFKIKKAFSITRYDVNIPVFNTFVTTTTSVAFSSF